MKGILPTSSSPDQTKGVVMEEKLRPLQFNVGMGTIEVAQERWAAYEEAAKKAGARSMAQWARDILDQGANFKEKI